MSDKKHDGIKDILLNNKITENGNVLKEKKESYKPGSASYRIAAENLFFGDNKDTKEYDWTQHPTHYNGHVVDTPTQSFNYETIDFIESSIKRWVSLGIPPEVAYSAGNALKYLDRLGGKPEEDKTFEEKAAEELEKAAWYCTRGSEKMRKEF